MSIKFSIRDGSDMPTKLCDIKEFISLYHAINYTIYSFDYYLKICIIF